VSGHFATGLSTFGRKPRAAVSPDMNVTPLVDVVLVLLIIFMVLAPVMSAHYDAKLPPPDEKDQQLAEQNDPLEPLVLRVEVDGTLRVGEVVLESDPKTARERIQRMLNARPNTLLYLDASDEASYRRVLDGMETAKLAGAKPVVLVTKEIPPNGG
jgi:biopolymer transport protein ExbD